MAHPLVPTGNDGATGAHLREMRGGGTGGAPYLGELSRPSRFLSPPAFSL